MYRHKPPDKHVHLHLSSRFVLPLPATGLPLEAEPTPLSPELLSVLGASAPWNCRLNFRSMPLLPLPPSFSVPALSALLRLLRFPVTFGTAVPSLAAASALISAAISGTFAAFAAVVIAGAFCAPCGIFISYPNIFFLCLFYISSCVNFKIHRP